MPMYNLIEYSDNRDDPNDNIIEFESFKFKTKITGKTPDADNKKMLRQQFL